MADHHLLKLLYYISSVCSESYEMQGEHHISDMDTTHFRKKDVDAAPYFICPSVFWSVQYVSDTKQHSQHMSFWSVCA